MLVEEIVGSFSEVEESDAQCVLEVSARRWQVQGREINAQPEGEKWVEFRHRGARLVGHSLRTPGNR